jgi:hypothetical protein
VTRTALARTVVLLEGVSDVAAVRALAERVAMSLDGVELVAMGGATNVGRYVQQSNGARLAGLCDVGEQRFFARALERAGLGADLDRERMASLGFFVCVADLEDELIRALGADGVERVIEGQGQLHLLRTFRNQPFQRSRTPVQQLRRFIGTTAGRKEQYGRALVDGLDLDRVPAPLSGLLAYVAAG